MGRNSKFPLRAIRLSGAPRTAPVLRGLGQADWLYRVLLSRPGTCTKAFCSFCALPVTLGSSQSTIPSWQYFDHAGGVLSSPQTHLRRTGRSVSEPCPTEQSERKRTAA